MHELLIWNRKINLTAITRPEDIAVKHFIDAIAPVDMIPNAARILDIGSGAGFPGLPLKIMRPDVDVTLIDSSRKKTSFMQHVIRQIGIDHARALQTRIEDFSGNDSEALAFDVIVSRAFTKAAALVRLAMPFIEKAGVLLIWKGPNIEDECYALKTIPEFKAKGLVINIQPYRLPLVQGERNLVSVKLA
jgi:16S rRNA (guanine527-N7)-methyltransferase